MILEQDRIDRFRRDGYLVLPGWDRELAERLRLEVPRLFEGERDQNLHCGRRFGAEGLASSHRIGGLAGNNALFTGAANEPRLLQVVSELLGGAEPFRDVLLSKPACSGGELGAHQDLAYWDVGHNNALTTWLALTGATKTSGCVWMIPGSHRRHYDHEIMLDGHPMPTWLRRSLRLAVSLTGTGDSPDTASERAFSRVKERVLETFTRRWPQYAGLADLEIPDSELPAGERVPVEAQPGDLVLFHGLTVHGSGTNRDDYRRDAYLVTYLGPSSSPVGQPEPRGD